MKLFFQLVLLTICVTHCSPPKSNQQESTADQTSEQSKKNTPEAAPESSLENFEGDRYYLILKYINNRAVVFLNDSLIYDSKTVDGAFEVEVDLSEYVKAGMTDLKVELYNGVPPYNTASPDWQIAYDIFINDELVEFVSEESKDGRIGLVHTETHDLSTIW